MKLPPVKTFSISSPFPNKNIIQLAGVVIYKDSYYINIHDFYGEIKLYNRKFSDIINTDSYLFTCKVSNDVLFVIKIEKISVYDEIFFWIETKSYQRILRLTNSKKKNNFL
ncbi:hypothetical protein CWI36_0732p0010 [Hamiltosporidium magnivora]|uniref:Uncharacterized protein n=1 Tax=Hamiltosporidium magnivora TaxID=148818 RepID=A0A4Q9LC60_9MICR|nr:hypothetical protein CWI36_0732p0010 [Hamiltosporidium magnivora]